VIGCGNQGRSHIKSLATFKEADVVYVADVDAERLAKAVSESGRAKGKGDFHSAKGLTMPRFGQQFALLFCLAEILTSAQVAFSVECDLPYVGFTRVQNKVTIAVDERAIATYYTEDGLITRPFLAHLRAPNGTQVTRRHPPIAGQDLEDHGTMHPGIWLSFGDISGSDYWRLRARTRHVQFTEEPSGGPGIGKFAVRNEYLDQKDASRVVCRENARYVFLVRPSGYLLLWDSTFSADEEFSFGDQEEMGVGIRIATPLRVGASGNAKLAAGTGTILDASGRKNEVEIWGNAADWCDYSGTIDGARVGITIFCHPQNFRASRFHARDYGLLVANPFGRRAFDQGGVSKIIVRAGESLRLRYGVLLHSGPQDRVLDLPAAYADYLDATSTP
jgi:hypothetical protein